LLPQIANRKSKIQSSRTHPNPIGPLKKNIFSVRVGQIGNQRKNSSSPQPMVSLPTRSSALDNQNTLTKSPADGKFRPVDLPIYIFFTQLPKSLLTQRELFLGRPPYADGAGPSQVYEVLAPAQTHNVEELKVQTYESDCSHRWTKPNQ